MSNLCIIPARGGSQRIPDKNIQVFMGRPIISYSIKVALSSGLFNEVMVSTDSEKIREIAISYGAKVPFMRSKENSSNSATTASALLEVIDEYSKQGKEFQYICCLYPTAPLLKEESLKEAYSALTQQGYDSVIPIVRYGYPIQRALRVDQNRLSWLWGENENSRSQDLETFYHDAGQYYWINTCAFLEQKKLFMLNTSYNLLNELQVQDIDNKEDLKLAKLKYLLNQEDQFAYEI